MNEIFVWIATTMPSLEIAGGRPSKIPIVIKYITIRGFINRNELNQLCEPGQMVKIFIIV